MIARTKTNVLFVNVFHSNSMTIRKFDQAARAKPVANVFGILDPFASISFLCQESHHNFPVASSSLILLEYNHEPIQSTMDRRR